MKGEHTPLYSRGDVSVKLSDGRSVMLALTPRACALLEERRKVDSYLDAFDDLAIVTQDKDGKVTDYKPRARNIDAVMRALLAGNGLNEELANEIPPLDGAIVARMLITAHLRPSGSDENPQKAADIG